MPPPSQPPNTTLYFAYGSNLSLSQMHTRCPTSTYLGIARLTGYTWLINQRGYANIVEATSPTQDPPPPAASEPEEKEEKEVYGLVYALPPASLASLDISEGVPTAYTKERQRVSFWASPAPDSPARVARDYAAARVDTTAQPPTETEVEMLVYIDRRRVGAGKPREEYVGRMERGVGDAVGLGVPRAYVEGVVRRFVPGG
ncbi:hypothetical protein P171DRAFT_424878 [Karstenula rhodostoma CBS 690.94]|uniref:gamma-glutamylcyclotransferase n=1 Tax=Karstenula rhodostoma CBS 690.94 TaxID=1392251 RepID=A0A9P4U5E7_9PLEO|nr:hypothetical protein P171DRAFT_424878 [Karstenula rhodostoma CBS 690.94]